VRDVGIYATKTSGGTSSTTEAHGVPFCDNGDYANQPSGWKIRTNATNCAVVSLKFIINGQAGQPTRGLVLDSGKNIIGDSIGFIDNGDGTGTGTFTPAVALSANTDYYFAVVADGGDPFAFVFNSADCSTPTAVPIAGLYLNWTGGLQDNADGPYAGEIVNAVVQVGGAGRGRFLLGAKGLQGG
jgi:hypothetical protein